MKRQREQMDTLDHEILNLLSENPQESYSKIKEKIGVSVGTIYIRSQKLKEWGVIKGARLVLDPKKLGYSLAVAVRLHVSDVPTALKALENRPEISTVHVLSGELNLIVYAYLKHVSDLHGLLQFFSQTLKADRSEVQIVLDTPIDRGVPIPKLESASLAPKKRRSPPSKN